MSWSLLCAVSLFAFGALPASAQALPTGWRLGGAAAQDYRTELDHEVRHGGTASARLSSSTRTPDGFGSLHQRVEAQPWQGQRVRLSAYLRTAGVQRWAGLFLRVDGARGPMAFANTQGSPLKGDTAWRRTELVVDVPRGARYVTFGVTLDGAGQSWVDDLRLEKVDRTVPVTEGVAHGSEQPGNLDFESTAGSLAPWFLSGNARTEYAATTVESVAHAGHGAGWLHPLVPHPHGYGVLMQSFFARRYKGHRVRASAFVRTEGVVARGDFWVRAQGVESPEDGPGLEYASVALPATSDWRRLDLVINVPIEAESLQFGAGIQGPGALYLDDVHLDFVDPATPLAPESSGQPLNMDFETPESP